MDSSWPTPLNCCEWPHGATAYVITKDVQFPQAKYLLRRQCSDLSLPIIMFPLCSEVPNLFNSWLHTFVHDGGMCIVFTCIDIRESVDSLCRVAPTCNICNT